MLVQRHGYALQAGSLECLAGTMVGRIFDEDSFTGIEQHGGAQGQRLLRAGEYQHPLRRGTGTPFEVDVVGDGAAQRLHALWRAVQQGAVAVLLEYLTLQALPGLQRKTAGFRYTRGEGARHQKITHAPVLEHGVAALAQTWRYLA